MKKKIIKKNYLLESIDYNLILIISDELDYYACIKKINKRIKPFVISNGDCLINNNYTILEILPKNENYSMRVYFNEEKEILQYYFDISSENGLDQETLVPYYYDLYLDVTYCNGKIELLDYNELEEALQSGIINDNQFSLAKKVASNLIEELKNGTNKYFNMDFKKEFFI
jgi:predicted RNA-binding protein associated with RNAse of E/G family